MGIESTYNVDLNPVILLLKAATLPPIAKGSYHLKADLNPVDLMLKAATLPPQLTTLVSFLRFTHHSISNRRTSQPALPPLPPLLLPCLPPLPPKFTTYTNHSISDKRTHIKLASALDPIHSPTRTFATRASSFAPPLLGPWPLSPIVDTSIPFISHGHASPILICTRRALTLGLAAPCIFARTHTHTLTTKQQELYSNQSARPTLLGIGSFLQALRHTHSYTHTHAHMHTCAHAYACLPVEGGGPPAS